MEFVNKLTTPGATEALKILNAAVPSLVPTRGATALTSQAIAPAVQAHLMNRREMLTVMAASAAMAGLTGCTKMPTQTIVPYVRQPEDVITADALFYATALTLGGIASGVLVETHMGRPTKVEGNPDHPASLGATDAFSQAATLSLYDPDRSQAVVHDGRIGSWEEFRREMNFALEAQKTKKGAGLRILTENVTSLSLAAQIQALLTAFPNARWHQFESVSRDAAREGSRQAFGEYVNTVYRLDQAQVILALDADFLMSFPGSVRYARDFAQSRRAQAPLESRNRLYVLEATPTVTGSVADHRLALRAGEIENFARGLAAELGVPGLSGRANLTGTAAAWVPVVARDLREHGGASIVIAGDQQPPAVHALAHAMNQQLGSFNRTVYFTDPLEPMAANHWQSINDLAAALRAGEVDLLIVIGGNPAYDAPIDLDLKSLLSKVPFSARLGLYEDETSAECHWHIPQTHILEEWGDARAYDGTISLVQPLIAPLYGGRSACDLLALLNGQPEIANHDVVRDYWRAHMPAQQSGDSKTNSSSSAVAPVSASGQGAFDAFWRKGLHDGVIAGTALPSKTVSLKANFDLPSAASTSGLEIVFRPDPTIWDGRFANNSWLQELPKPLTTLAWDSVAMMSPITAGRLGLKSEDTVELKYSGRTVRAPVWALTGHADDSVTVFLGYGRARSGHVGTGIGFDAGWIRPLSTQWFGSGLSVRKAGLRWPLAQRQQFFQMEGRDFVRSATLAEYQKNPSFAQTNARPVYPSLYPPWKKGGYQWGMAIDLNACTGCGACVVACQAENNIAVVGKEQVMRGRPMHWIRIDHYSEEPNGRINSSQPVLCMHCEDAPCELVCPVGATVHSPEGLNEMVYNRCVGTRYCSNNCPYKVRRFNFLLYSDWTTPSLYALRNPNVTVRSRGVMEKCTYCVQRINAAKIKAEEQDRPVRDGEIVTACQQACPTQAIMFGNIADPNSRVSKLKATMLYYGLLEELNTRPRTTFEARLRNPNAEMPGENS